MVSLSVSELQSGGRTSWIKSLSLSSEISSKMQPTLKFLFVSVNSLIEILLGWGGKRHQYSRMFAGCVYGPYSLWVCREVLRGLIESAPLCTKDVNKQTHREKTAPQQNQLQTTFTCNCKHYNVQFPYSCWREINDKFLDTPKVDRTISTPSGEVEPVMLWLNVGSVDMLLRVVGTPVGSRRYAT